MQRALRGSAESQGRKGTQEFVDSFVRCSGTFDVRPCGLCAVGFRCHVPSCWTGLRCLRTDRKHDDQTRTAAQGRSPDIFTPCRSPQPAGAARRVGLRKSSSLYGG